MEKVKLLVGHNYAFRPVEFVGEMVAECACTLDHASEGRVSSEQTLYRTEDGRFLVYSVAAPSGPVAREIYLLREIPEGALLEGAEFEELGRAAGLWGPGPDEGSKHG
jgi:hypothetical protein